MMTTCRIYAEPLKTQVTDRHTFSEFLLPKTYISVHAYSILSPCMINVEPDKKLEKVSMGHGCPRLLFLFHLQLNIGYILFYQQGT